ncbi:MAG: PilZ domain-containing protein [Candidatus Omnitrophica bacterium]|nr:PilZ domain-containing protein [Candidatus Omnitrophota bacterium]MDD5488031.1 PilZ domain-containing protein [Candidatus Omnitrophota bacterium]
MEHQERRRFIRHLLVNPVEFRIEEDRGYEKTNTLDTSEGGLLFLSKTEVASGTTISLQMPLYDKVFKIRARVVHSTKDEESGLFRVGVVFVNFSDAFKVKLIEQIYLIEEYRVLRSLQLGRDMTLKEASEEWVKKYSERFQKLYW